jgi:ADP-ribose pyrophosphatase YjhB (NUDIX family)
VSEQASPRQVHRISAGAIVERDGRILLVRHCRTGRYDFWVCPGGGVQDDEELADAAVREVREECGLQVRVSKLLYIEELINPECRYVKFWFSGEHVAGALSTAQPEAVAEHIVQAAWLPPAEFPGKSVFPPVLAGRYWQDRDMGFPKVVRLPPRRMEFW